jgi:hypothetical protein
MCLNGKQYEPTKDDLGFNKDQESILEAERADEQKEDAIQETLKSYWNNFRKPTIEKGKYIGSIFEEMIEAIKAIDDSITAEAMFDLICSDFLHLGIIKRDKESFIGDLFYDEAIFNIKSLVLIALYPSFPDEDLHKIKNELLTK